MSKLNVKKNLLKCNSFFSTQVKINQGISSENVMKQNEKENEDEINKKINNIISINLADLKEKTHKDYIQFQHRINDSIQNYSQKINKLTDGEKRLIEQFADIKYKTDKIEILSDKLSEISDRLTTCEIRLNNLSKDFREAVSKYDDLFLDNMTVPGKIGKYCKYKNIKEFLSYTFNKFNEFDLKKESDAAKTKYNLEKIDKFIKKINFEMDIIREESVQIASKKIGFLEKKVTDDLFEITRKIESIPNDNLFSEYEKKINALMENYNNDLKEIKEILNFKIINIENDIELLKECKSPQNKNNSEKKNIKVSFSNIIGSKSYQNKKHDEGDINSKNNKVSNSSKNIKNMKKYYSLNINKFYKENANNNININSKIIKNEHNSINLGNINEVYEETNDNNNKISPLNNILLKSVNFATHRLKNKNPINDENKNNNYNKKLSETISDMNKNLGNDSFNSQIFNDSSDKEEKKEKLEEIIIQNDKTEIKDIINKNLRKGIKKSKSIWNKNKNELFNRKTKKNFHDKKKVMNNLNSDSKKRNKNKIKNYHSFPNDKSNNNSIKLKNNSLNINLGKKNDNFIRKESDNINNTFGVQNILRKNNSIETSTIKIKDLYKNKTDDLISLRDNEDFNIKSRYNKNKDKDKDSYTTKNNNIISNNSNNNNNQNNNVHITRNNNNINSSSNNNNSNINDYWSKYIKQNNSANNINSNSNNYFNKNLKLNNSANNINNNINKQNKQNTQIFNNKTIKNYVMEKNYKTNNNKNYLEYPIINNNYSTSISIGNISDVSFLNNIQFSNHEINRKNKELPIKQRYYNLLHLENQKKEEESQENKHLLFNPKEIPIVTNSLSKSQSNSKKKMKKEKFLPYLNYKNRINNRVKKKNNNINIQLKVVPTNFKESKKIQVSLNDY